MNCQTCNPSPWLADPLAKLPPAMAYVPWQGAFGETFEPCRALQLGTIFPALCKPFCGKRGKCV